MTNFLATRSFTGPSVEMTCDRELVTEGVDARIARSQVGPVDAGQDDPVILVGMPQRAKDGGAGV